MIVDRIFLESKPAITDYGHYYLVKRRIDLETGQPIYSEADEVIRGGPDGLIYFLVTDSGALYESGDAYEDENGEKTEYFDLTVDRVQKDITDLLLDANLELDVFGIWDVMKNVVIGIGQAKYDYELPDFSDNHLANSNAVILTVLNAVNFDVRTIEAELELLNEGGISYYGYGFAGATNKESTSDSDPTILGQGDIPEIAASAALTAGVAMLGRGDVSDFFIGTVHKDRYYGYQEFEISFLTEDTVSFERLVEDVSLGELGLTIRLAPKDLGTLFKPEGIEVAGVNFNGDGSASAESDFLHSIERVELTHNPDRFEIDDAALDADILVDMGASRRTQAEIDALNAAPGPDDEPYELEDDAFLRNLDIADYSNVSTGLIYADGRTAEREQGLLATGGIFNLAGHDEEAAHLHGDNPTEHALKLEGADEIRLTDHDDVLVAADIGTIVDLGEGEDKVWFNDGLLVKNFGDDDRLTLFGAVNLYGGSRNEAWETPWASGHWGMQYGLNGEGDLVVRSPWWTDADGSAREIYIAGWQEAQAVDEKALVDGSFNTGPGDIGLAEFEFESSLLVEADTSRLKITGLWDYWIFKMRTLAGSEIFGEETADPLVLDLDGDGIELAWRTSASAHFDVDYDLYAEPTAFAGPDDGVLARDIDGNGAIDDGSELFGHGNHVHGFAVLAGLDGNGDGVVDAGDDGLADFNGDGTVNASDRFGDLLVWRDINADMVSQENELTTLDEAGITGFTLPAVLPDAADPQPIDTINGNHVLAYGSFSRADGTNGQVGEVLFNIDDKATVYDGPDIAVTAAAAALPDLRGYGTLTGLRAALSFMADPTDPAEQAAADARAGQFAALIDGFTSPEMAAMVEAFRPVAQLWAGSAPYRNEAGEIVTGMTAYADLDVLRADGDVVDYIRGGEQVSQQVDGKTQITTTLHLGGGGHISHVQIMDGGAPAYGDWQALRDALLAGAISIDTGVSGPDGTDHAIDAGSGISWSSAGSGQSGDGNRWGLALADPQAAVTQLTLDAVTSHEVTPGADFGFFERYVGEPMDAFFAAPAQGSDPVGTLVGTLQAMEESYRGLAVRIAVQDGPLSGFFHDLAYDAATDRFYGIDAARQLGGVYESLFTAAGAQTDPYGWLAGWEPFLDVVIGDYDRGESWLHANKAFIMQNMIDGLETSGAALDFTAVMSALDLPLELIRDGAGDLAGTSGVDLFYLNGDETSVDGGAGTDFYVFGRQIGHVVIDDIEPVLSASTQDQIRFSQHAATELGFSRDDRDLVITVLATGETITVTDQFRGIWPGQFIRNAWEESGVHEIIFADGEVWSPVEIVKAVSYADGQASTVTGTDSTDYLEGGTGNDRLVGAGDYDIYRFNLGDGTDEINDHEQNPFRTFADAISFGSGIRREDVSFDRDGGGLDLIVRYGDQGDSITVEKQFFKLHTGVFGSYFDHSIEYLLFESGEFIDQERIMAELLLQQFTPGDDVIYGFDRDDTIDGGAGDDWMQGGNGNDTYRFGYGYGTDVIEDKLSNILSGQVDTVEFEQGIAFEDVTLSRDGNSNDLRIALSDGSNLTIAGQFSATFAGPFGTIMFNQIENLVFTDENGDRYIATPGQIRIRLLDHYSTDGDDQIFGFFSSDVLTGGMGDDFLQGGDGDDVYRYALGDGNDVIYDRMGNILSGTHDALEFGAGITPSDVAVARGVGDRSSDMILNILPTGESITFREQHSYTTIDYKRDQIEEVRFVDGTVWTASDMRASYLAGAATDGNDTIVGFFSDDLMAGGAGDDYLAGGDGADTYLFGYGDGNDTIMESVGYVTYSDDDAVRFGAGISTSDVQFSIGARHNDLIVTLVPTGETLTILDQNRTSAWFTWNDIERFEFESGEVIDKQAVQALLLESQATDGDDVITGFSSDDILDGGAGDDRLEGGAGADIYRFGYGYGHDVVYDNLGYLLLKDGDAIEFGPGIALTDVTFLGAGTNDLIVTLNETGETLTIEGYLGGFDFTHVEELRFEDGTVLGREQVVAILVGEQATDGDDIIDGTNADDVMAGGTGNDVLRGGGGDDTYIFRAGDGRDVIEDGGFATNECLVIEGYDPKEVAIARNGNTLILTFTGSGDRIEIPEGLNGNSFNQIETFEFSDGTVWTIDEVRTRIVAEQATDGDDYVAGFGGWSNSQIGDTLTGGPGDDTLTGHDGGDLYHYARGDGYDTIVDRGFWGEDVVEISGYSTAEIRFDRRYPTSSDLLISFASGQDRLLILNTLNEDDFDGIEKIRLDDGTEFSMADIRAELTDRDILDAENPLLIGFSFDETLNITREKDLVLGSHGNDTFVFERGDGRVKIGDESFDANDVLRLVNIAPEEVTLRRLFPSRSDLMISTGTDDEIIIYDTLDSGSFKTIEQIVFDDGTSWDRATFTRMADATPIPSYVGNAASELFESSTEDEYFSGGAGSDTYVYELGDGTDVISDRGSFSTDRILIHGVLPADLSISRSALDSSDLLIEFPDGHTLIVEGTLAGGYTQQIEQIVFDDGTVWDTALLRSQLLDSAATEGNDIIHGFSGNDHLRGGGGRDLLIGEGGNDVYRFNAGDGLIVIDDGGYSSEDKVFISGYTPAETRLAYQSPADKNSLKILFTGSHDEIVVRAFDSAGSAVESIEFDDGTVWTLSQIKAILEGGAPVAADDGNFSMEIAGMLGIDAAALTANDVSPAGGTLTVLEVMNATNGQVTLENGTITVEPEPDFTGVLQFQYRVSDGHGGSDVASVRVEVAAPEAPLPNNSLVLTAADLLGVTDAAGVEIASITNVNGGTAIIIDGTSVEFVPDSEFSSTIGFDYQLDLGGGETLSGNYAALSDNANHAPVLDEALADQSFLEDQPLAFSVLEKFSDSDGDALQFQASLAEGSALPDWLTFNPLTAAFAGMPPTDYNSRLSGPIELQVTAFDGSFAVSSTFDLAITPVNDAPTIEAPLADLFLQSGDTFSIPLQKDLFTDVDGDPLSFAVTLANGSALPAWLTIDTDLLRISGTAPSQAEAFDILVTASDGTSTVSDTFALTVSQTNVAPTVGTMLANQSFAEDTPFSFTIPAGTFIDADGDALVQSATLLDGSALPGWLDFDTAVGNFVGTPPQDFYGSISLRVTASDGEFEVSDDFALEITSVNDAPVAANDSGFSTVIEQTLKIPAANLLANDSDVDGDTIELVTAGGAAAGEVWLNSDGEIVYRPDAGFVGTDRFTYVITDGEEIATAQVEIAVSDPFDGFETGTEGDDFINGDKKQENRIYTGAGDDRVTGGLLDDQIFTGSGNDFVASLKGDDHVDGGRGDDRIIAGNGNDTVAGGEGNDWVWGGSGDDHVDGGEGNDRFRGGPGDDHFDGGRGDDRVWGGSGDDHVDGGEGNDRVWGGSGDDHVDGGEGNDRIIAGNGNDRVWGGSGDDSFIFASGDGRDTIMDYEYGVRQNELYVGGDRIILDINEIDSFEDLMGYARQTGDGVEFDFGSGDLLVLNGTQLAALDNDAFTFY